LGLKTVDITLDILKQMIGGKWLKEPEKAVNRLHIREISIDSRTLCSGDVFWAIKGERYDGHDFIEEAFEKGAIAAVISKSLHFRPVHGSLIQVDDTLISLQRLATEWRKKHSCPLIAVTGSSGKTTTKEMISKVLGQKYNCLSTKGNMNNNIGVSLTMLRLRESHEVAVIELGMNHQGEIAQLTSIVKPTIGVITNIGKAHIGFLGSVNHIIEAKAELLEGMDPDGLAILNRDDPYYYILAERCQNGVITVGESEKADFRIIKVDLFPKEGRTEVVIKIKGEILSLSLPMLGKFIAHNLVMAVAVAMELDCGLKEIKTGIAEFQPIPNRMDHFIVKDIHILDDSYNANPESMHSALSTLFECKGSAKSMAILGDMLELGNQSECLHRQLGQWLGHNNKVDFLITLGSQAKIMAQEAVKTGYPSQNVWSIEEHEKASILASSLLKAGDWVLIKGSRQMGLDKISKRLVEIINSSNSNNGSQNKVWNKEETHRCSTI
jgi:UDP-N-acetylmuramoyl-tripeptide--D-alanyl-D-alanine ligase